MSNDQLPGKIRVFGHKETFGPEYGMREGTQLNPVPMNFFFNEGGLGDYICYSVAILWLAEHSPWIRGKLRVPKFFVPLAERFLRRHINWEVVNGEIPYTFEGDIPIIGPELKSEDGRNMTPQLINATGSHLVDLGFCYYANKNPGPPDATYPRLTLKEGELPHSVAKLKGKYVVFTPGGVTSSRTVRGKHLNPLIQYVCERGLTPVFLGKTDFSDDLKVSFDEEINYEAGLNLIDKTTLFEAASVMENAVCVTGLDNGLLHLAATTEANVIFGYNIAGPKSRRPRRNWGRLTEITVPQAKLACIHCQDHIKMLSTHTFHRCLYGDTKCIDLLFGENAARWKMAIDEMLPPEL